MIKGAKLQIKQLSVSGELLNVINCPPGKITALRAYTPSQLEPYQRAISGIPGKEKILVAINGQEFIPEQNELIGFGEDYRTIPTSVAQYLTSYGVPPGSMNAILNSYGLSNVANSAFSKITACEARRTQLVAITYQIKKITVLNNPFDILTSEWRERMAELLLNYVRNNHVPLLVTSLEYRPECWINNEIINRVQVGDSAKRTIGFGNDASELNDILKQVRQASPGISNKEKNPPQTSNTQNRNSVFPDPVDLQESITSRKEKPHSSSRQTSRATGTIKSQQIKSIKVATPKPYGVMSILRHRIFKLSFGTAVIAILGLTLSSKFSYLWTEKTPIVASNPSNNESTTQEPVASPAESPISIPTVEETPEVKAVQEPAKNEDPVLSAIDKNVGQVFIPPVVENPTPIQIVDTQPIEEAQDKKLSIITEQQSDNGYVLEMYSQNIRNSIMESFQGEESARSGYLQYANLSKVKPKAVNIFINNKASSAQGEQFTEDLLKALQTTDGSGSQLPDSPTRSYQSQSSSAGGYDIATLESKNYADLTKEERRVLLREKFREAIERASQNR